ncbi:hypothetical protein ACH5RR_039065 [Cinchona calisaya]|uniref:Binding partner of ACD11 1 n=1 Tax=Cinchona calisaya TaxID=153742 RepID=A0ABD2Y0J0_9GENT
MNLIRTVKVSNVLLGLHLSGTSRSSFPFSGDIEYVEMRSDTERSQIAYVTFKDSQGAETAVLLSLICPVTITPEPEYQLPPSASAPPLMEGKTAGGAESAFRKTEDVVSSMLAKGFVLGKDAVNKAKTFDEKHQLTSTASAKVTSFDKKIGLTEKISIGTSIVNDKVREMDQKLQVSEKAKSAFAAAEQSVSSAGTGQKTKEKVGIAEDEQRRKMVDDYAQIHLSESPKASGSSEHKPSKPAPAQGVSCSVWGFPEGCNAHGVFRDG